MTQPAASASSRSGRPQAFLVAYASRTQTTAEVAQAIARALGALGHRADLRPAAQVGGLDGYDAVIVGSAVRFGTWLDPALALLRRHRAAFAARPVAFFSLHLQADGASEEGRARRAAYTRAARAIVTPREDVFFLGALLPDRLSLLDRLAVKAIGAPLGDRRDWGAIEAWARALPARLQTA